MSGLNLTLPGRGVVSQSEPVSVPMSCGLLYAKKVIVKFDVKQMTHIPPGLEERPYPGVTAAEKQYKIKAQMARRPDLAKFAKWRKDHYDTGFPFTPQPTKDSREAGVLFAHVALMRTGLANVRIAADDPSRKESFFLSDIYFFQQVKMPKASACNKHPRPTTVYSIMVEFTRCTPEEAAERNKALSRETIEQVRLLASTTWHYIHGWSNPLDENVVVHCTGMLLGQKPKHTFRIQDRFIVVSKVEDTVKPEEEFDPTNLPDGLEAEDLMALSEQQLATVADGDTIK